MAECREGHQSPEIALHKGEARAIEDADDGERDQQRRDGSRLGREEPDMEAQHRIEAELAGNHHGHGDRRFTEGVCEPAVQREDRHLDREGEQKRERDPEQCAGRKSSPCVSRSCSVTKSKLPVRA